jgi:hypothetical protein
MLMKRPAWTHGDRHRVTSGPRLVKLPALNQVVDRSVDLCLLSDSSGKDIAPDVPSNCVAKALPSSLWDEELAPAESQSLVL